MAKRVPLWTKGLRGCLLARPPMHDLLAADLAAGRIRTAFGSYDWEDMHRLLRPSERVALRQATSTVQA
jgi:hypothetical protein